MAQVASEAGGEGEVAAGEGILRGELEDVVWNEDVPAPPTKIWPSLSPFYSFIVILLGER